MKSRIIIKLFTLGLLGAVFIAAKVNAAAPDAKTIVSNSLQVFYSAANDMTTRVKMRLINSQGRERRREMTMLRKDINESGDQRYFIYFHMPADIKNTTFMVWKYEKKDDDRWIYIPAIKLVKRIAADDKRSSFVGSDFSYEDISGRNIDDESHKLLKSIKYANRPAYMVESRPNEPADYVRRVSWIDQKTWIPLKEEYFDARNQKVKVFTADKIEKIGKHYTVTQRTMKNLQTGHQTKASFEAIKYDVGLEDSLFNERYLRNPPRKWIR
jgi:outer membrane lipoprotein-sorting protein